MEIFPFTGAAKELQNMKDIKNQRLQKLRSRDRETEKALVWLESHGDLFQEPIFAPVLVLVGESREFLRWLVYLRNTAIIQSVL